MPEPLSPPEIARLYSARLRGMVRTTPQADEERSFRLRPGRLETRRFLLGVPPANWSLLPLASFREKLDMPRRLQQEFLEQLDRADLLGLAYEEEEGGCALQALLELPNPLRRSRQVSEEDGPVLMGRGYRWLPGHADEGSRSMYQWWPGLDARGIARRVTALLADRTPGTLRAAALSIMGRALNDSNALDWAYLELSFEPDRPVSFDVDLSVAEIPLGELQPQLAVLADAFRIPAEALPLALESTAENALNRLSGGLDEQGRPFLTVHYEA